MSNTAAMNGEIKRHQNGAPATKKPSGVPLSMVSLFEKEEGFDVIAIWPEERLDIIRTHGRVYYVRHADLRWDWSLPLYRKVVVPARSRGQGKARVTYQEAAEIIAKYPFELVPHFSALGAKYNLGKLDNAIANKNLEYDRYGGRRTELGPKVGSFSSITRPESETDRPPAPQVTRPTSGIMKTTVTTFRGNLLDGTEIAAYVMPSGNIAYRRGRGEEVQELPREEAAVLRDLLTQVLDEPY